MNVAASARAYDPKRAGLADDLCGPTGPVEPMLARVDPLLSAPIDLTDAEVADLVDFVGNALLDERARSENLRSLIPATVPSGRPVLHFEQ